MNTFYSRPHLLLRERPLKSEHLFSLLEAIGASSTVAHRSTHPDVVRLLAANGFGVRLAGIEPYVGWRKNRQAGLSPERSCRCNSPDSHGWHQ